MPLLEGKENMGKNYKELEEANKSKPDTKKRPKRQIIAIMLREAGVPPPPKKSK